MLKCPTAPSYFSYLIPESVENIATYGLRNSDHIRNLQCNTQHLATSFLDSTISEWNKLPPPAKSAGSTLSTFKNAHISKAIMIELVYILLNIMWKKYIFLFQ